MMGTRRRFREIELRFGSDEIVDLGRVVGAIGKFCTHTKKFHIEVESCFNRNQLVAVLNACLGVTSLSLRVRNLSEGRRDGELMQLDKLKRLELFAEPEAQMIIAAIPDGCLKEFLIGSLEDTNFNNSDLQTFLNRQKNIEALNLGSEREVDFNHLNLRELKLSHTSAKVIASICRQQGLKSLTVRGAIDNSAFKSMCQLEQLAILATSIEHVDETVLLNLRLLPSLKELELYKEDIEDDYGETWPGLKQLSQLEMPQLLKLVLELGRTVVDAEALFALSRSFQNLKTLEVRSYEIGFLSAFCGHFQTLKRLRVISKASYVGYQHEQETPPLNTTLEEIEITSSTDSHCGRPIYIKVNAFRNLKKILLRGIGAFGPEVYEMIQLHHRLEEFTLIVPENLNAKRDDFDETLTEIINHFINAPQFVKLHLGNIPVFQENHVKGLFSGIFSDFTVKKVNELNGTMSLTCIKNDRV